MKTVSTVFVYQNVFDGDTFVSARNFSDAEQVRFGYLKVKTAKVEHEKLTREEVKEKLRGMQPQGDNKALYTL